MNFQPNNITTDQIIPEILQCNFRLDKVDDSHIKISWDLPLDSNNQLHTAYNGVVIIASSSPKKILLTDGQQYDFDPTTSVTNHVGDTVNGCLVVFSCFDKVTNSCIIESNISTYFYVFGCNRHLQYTPFSISLNYDQHTQKPNFKDATKGYQLLQILDKSVTDPITFRPTPSTSTETIEIDIGFPVESFTLTYNVSGITYQNLIDQFNTQAKITSADFVNNNPYNMGTIWLRNSQVYEWNGFVFSQKTIISQSTQPHLYVDGTIWKNASNFNIRSNPSWNPISVIIKPTLNVTTNTFWYNNTNVYKWEGNIWVQQTLFDQLTEPGIPDYNNLDGQYWLDGTNNTLYHIEQAKLIKKSAITSVVDPLLFPVGFYWINLKDEFIKELTLSGWISHTITIGRDCIPSTITTKFYYDKDSGQLLDLLLDVVVTDFVISQQDPLLLPSYSLWFNPQNNELKINNNGTWVLCDLIISNINPLIQEEMDIDTIWKKGPQFYVYKGYWEPISPILSISDPNIININDYVFETSTQKLFQYTSPSTYIELTYINSSIDPTVITLGEYWLNGTSLSVWNGISYVPVIYTTNDPSPNIGFKWYQPSTNSLSVWDGTSYTITSPDFGMEWDNGLKVVNNNTGSDSVIIWKKYLPIEGVLVKPYIGGDAVSSERMQHELNVGGHENDLTDRINIIEYVKRTLGAPTNVVELSEAQLNDCVDSALRTLRLYSSVSVDKKVMLMELVPNQSVYLLSNRKLNYHKITQILQIHRLPSAFLTAVGSSQIYGQLVLQQLYRAGSFDLLSYHMVASYIEQMEHMFAAKISFTWNERSRELTIYNVSGRNEIVLIECAIERTENDLLTDRRTEDWVRRWACAEARERLAEIRGKFTTLPGAGGGISLNVADLIQKATEDKDRCMKDIDNFIVNNAEDFGGRAMFLLG